MKFKPTIGSFLKKRKDRQTFTYIQRMKNRFIFRAALTPQCFWHRVFLVEFGYSKRQMKQNNRYCFKRKQ